MSNTFAAPWTIAPDSSVHGILQARILEWVAISFSTGSFSPRDQTQGISGGSVVKNPPGNAGDAGSTPGSGRLLGEEMATYSSILAWRIPGKMEWNGLQCMGRQRVGHDWATNAQWQFRGFPGGISGKEPAGQCKRHKRPQVQSLGQEEPLEEDTATHFSILAWRIPGIEETGGLQSTGLQSVRHDSRDLAQWWFIA